MHIFLKENSSITFVFLYSFCAFLTILSQFAFSIVNFFFVFRFNLFLKHFVIKLLALCALLYYLNVLL